jgi:TonB family protein
MILRERVLVLVFALSVATACSGQNADARKSTGCVAPAREHGAIPTGPFKFLPKESYKHAPVVSFQIHEDGSVTDAKIVRSSGVRDIDKKLLEAVANWKYKPNPGCGVVSTEMTVTIDWQ